MVSAASLHWARRFRTLKRRVSAVPSWDWGVATRAGVISRHSLEATLIPNLEMRQKEGKAGFLIAPWVACRPLKVT